MGARKKQNRMALGASLSVDLAQATSSLGSPRKLPLIVDLCLESGQIHITSPFLNRKWQWHREVGVHNQRFVEALRGFGFLQAREKNTIDINLGSRTVALDPFFVQPEVPRVQSGISSGLEVLFTGSVCHDLLRTWSNS
eukprot:802436-Amphidinium_carterae.1